MEGTITKRKRVSKSQCDRRQSLAKTGQNEQRVTRTLRSQARNEGLSQAAGNRHGESLGETIGSREQSRWLGRVGCGDQRPEAGDNDKNIVEIVFVVVQSLSCDQWVAVVTILKHLLCFSHVHYLITPHKNSIKQYHYYPHLIHGNRGMKRSNNLPKVTELLSGKRQGFKPKPFFHALL